jgi:IS5 family transposase
VKLRALDIARAARSRAKQSSLKLKRAYGQLLNSTSRVVGQAKQFSAQIAAGVKRANNAIGQLKLDRLRNQIEEMVPRVKQVMKTDQGSDLSRRYALGRQASERV